jgi:hypothetical protein
METAYLYKYANDLLECVISTYFFLQEYMSGEETTPIPTRTWYGNAVKLANVLMDEEASSVEILRTREEEVRFEKEADEYIFDWADQMRQNAKKLGQIYVPLKIGTILYHEYVLWLSKVVSEYDNLMFRQEILDSEYSKRYKDNAPIFSALQHSLGEELQAANLDQISESDKDQNWKDVSSFVHAMSQTWASLVISVSLRMRENKN